NYNTISPEDFGFSDGNDYPSNNFLGVVITTVPANGHLIRDGQTLAAGSFVSFADLTAGKLAYEPPIGEFGIPYTSFTFQVQDDGGTDNGGIDLDPTPNTMTIDVRYWCGRPTFGLATNLYAFEGQTQSLSLEDFSLYDPQGGDLPDLRYVKVTVISLPAIGVLRDAGLPVTAGQIVSGDDIYAGLLTYTPSAGSGGKSASFEA